MVRAQQRQLSRAGELRRESTGVRRLQVGQNRLLPQKTWLPLLDVLGPDQAARQLSGFTGEEPICDAIPPPALKLHVRLLAGSAAMTALRQL